MRPLHTEDPPGTWDGAHLWTRARAAYRCGNSVTNSTKFKRTQKPTDKRRKRNNEQTEQTERENEGKGRGGEREAKGREKNKKGRRIRTNERRAKIKKLTL